MRASEAFPSQWLKADDLQGRTVNCIISNVKMEKIGDDQKLVLEFQGKSKGMVLNKTNCSVISAVYGDETEDWMGQPIQVYPTECDYQGKRMACLRVRIPPRPRQAPAAAPGQAAPPPPPGAEADDGDAIPF